MQTQPNLQAHLEGLAQAFPGTVAYFIENLQTQQSISMHPQRSFYAASTIKLPLLLMALQQGHDLQQTVPIGAHTKALGSGVLKELHQSQLSLQDLLTLMIIVSDNTATNVVLEFLGHKGPINRFFADSGWSNTHAAGMLSLPDHRPDPLRHPADYSRTTAADLASMLRSLWQGQGYSSHQQQTALEILGKQQYTSFLRYLPADLDDLEEGTTPLKLYSKSGEIRRFRHDCGILAKGNQAALLCVLTESDADPRFHPDHPAVLLMGRVAQAVYSSWLV